MQPDRNTALEQLYKSIQTFGSLSMAAESRDKLYRYNDALMQSLYSILEDQECDETSKLQFLDTTLEQYAAAMRELFPKLIQVQNPTGRPVVKADPDRFIEIIEVDKFNPYHDNRGRFATANSHTSFTIRTRDPNKQHLADMAIAREKVRDQQGLVPGSKTTSEKPKAPKKETKPGNPTGDPETIAGVKRGDPMTREEADKGKANPNYLQGGGYRTNCQSCVVAYEARRRGYDVTTKPNTRGSALDKLSRASHEAWIDPKTGKTPERPQPNEFVKTPKQCRNMLENTIQPGERYTLGHSWKGRSRTGHIICADKDANGNLRLFDPQSGTTMMGKDIDNYLSRVKYTTSVYGYKINCSPRLLRVDNLSINPAYADDIMEAKTA